MISRERLQRESFLLLVAFAKTRRKAAKSGIRKPSLPGLRGHLEGKRTFARSQFGPTSVLDL